MTAPKICQGQPPTFGSQCSKFYPNWFIFGGVIAERVKAVLLAHICNIRLRANKVIDCFMRPVRLGIVLKNSPKI